MQFFHSISIFSIIPLTIESSFKFIVLIVGKKIRFKEPDSGSTLDVSVMRSQAIHEAGALRWWHKPFIFYICAHILLNFSSNSPMNILYFCVIVIHFPVKSMSIITSNTSYFPWELRVVQITYASLLLLTKKIELLYKSHNLKENIQSFTSANT